MATDAKPTQRELNEWLRELIIQATVNRQPSWHLRAAKAGMRKRQPRLIEEAQCTRS